jgi:hypothetical protein
MEIIVRKKESEVERRKAETSAQILRHYYEREIRDGSRFRSKAGTKKQIKEAYKCFNPLNTTHNMRPT